MENQLRNILNTLNQIEVRGQENLDMLLGCILTIEKIIAENKQQEAQNKAKEGGAGDDHNERGNDA